MLTSVAVPVTNNMFLSNQAVEASATSDDFLSKVSLQAQKTSKKYGVYASLMLAQAALESGWGTSTLSTQANNFFGMKATGWTGATYSVKTAEQDGNGKTYYIVAPFRKYISCQDSFDDYGLKMRTTLDNYGGLRYSKTWLENASSPSAAAKAIKASGYATDKNYASKLINHITSYNLTKYDPVYSSDVYTVKVAKSGATYLYPTDHAVSPKRSYVTAGKDVTVTKTFTYYNGKKRMYLKGLGWINGEDLNTGSSQAPSADTNATVSGQMKILMHSAAIYTSTGAKSSAKSVKAGKSMMTYGSVTINGAKYYRVNSASADQFIKASNFDGSPRKLKHNAYLYNSKGKRVGKSKWLKGSSHTVYGGSVKIKHKQYYIVGLNQYVKKGNF
ncbi:amidase [Lactobacillus delbrueckii subsp. delbrueckii DSM 20074 = JCM 1012]|nr:amidase [Lactobacillus delbrueckii subsp. delbrueckii DSM 20074 = JCM 1012]